MPALALYLHPEGTECPELADPENGMVKQTGGRGVGSQVWYMCDTGYVLVGSEVRTCQDDLQWDPEEPVCKRELIKICTSQGVC